METIKEFLPLYGKWDTKEGQVCFQKQATDASTTHGLILSKHTLTDGAIEAEVMLSDASKGGATVVFRANGHTQFYAAGIGGWENAFTLFQATNMSSFTRLAGVGANSNLESNKKYLIRIQIEGQRVDVLIDGVKLITYSGITSNEANTVGAFCFNTTPSATFNEIRLTSSKPKAFIAMQFSEPYNEVYRDAIQPLVSEIGFEPLRVDDVHSPGIIINDILSNLVETSIVISDISERNANVYYELGIAHALAKPTILLAVKGTSLPFDVGAHRCIFYENTIPGRAKLQNSLRRSLSSILKREIA